MNRKEKLKKLKESGKLKEFAIEVAKKRLVKEGLYDIDDMLAKLGNDERGGIDRDEFERIPDVDDDAFDVLSDEEDEYDLDALDRIAQRDSRVGNKPELSNDLFGGSDSDIGDATVPGIKKANLEDTIDELDMETRQDLKARRDTEGKVREGLYTAYDRSGKEITDIEAMSVEDAAGQISSSGRDWYMIKDEQGIDSIMADEYDTYYDDDMNDLEVPSDEYFMDQEKDGTLDDLVASYDEEYPEDEEDDYFEEGIDLNENLVESFEDGIFHHKYRGNIVLQEHKQRKTLDNWGEFWSSKSK